MIGCSGNNVTPREGELVGRILDVRGNPVEDAIVSWQYDNTRWSYTDENGRFHIEAIGFGKQKFKVEAFSYRTFEFTAAIYSGAVSYAEDQFMQGKSFGYSHIKVDEVAATWARITWFTNDYTNGLVEFGEDESMGRTIREPANEYTTNHELVIHGLRPETLYYFRIIASRQGRDAETSQTGTFVTKSALEDTSAPAAPRGVDVALSQQPNQATVFWAPSPEADLKGYKVYRSEIADSAFERVSQMMIPAGQTRYTDNTVVAGRKYYYRVTAVDQANNESGYNNIASVLVPGVISGHVRWTRAASPYYLKGDINIVRTGRLLIDSGVEVKIADYDILSDNDQSKIDFIVTGTLIAGDSIGQPVTFSAKKTNPSKNTWNGIRFLNSRSDDNIVLNTVISDADTGLTLENSKGTFENIKIINCNTGLAAVNNNNDTVVNDIEIKRVDTGVELSGNEGLTVSNVTVVHPRVAMHTEANDNLRVHKCNFLEYTDVGIVTDEPSSQARFDNNLFVSPVGMGMRVVSRDPLIEYNTFDSPSGIQIVEGLPVIRKNLFLTSRSLIEGGRKAIEHLPAAEPEFGPNNIHGFSEDDRYVGCAPADGSSAERLLFLRELTGDEYDYRLREPFPDSQDFWGINRTKIPY